jgi:hypothetical protein
MGDGLVQLFLSGFGQVFGVLIPQDVRDLLQSGPPWQRVLALLFYGPLIIIYFLVASAIVMLVGSMIWQFVTGLIAAV